MADSSVFNQISNCLKLKRLYFFFWPRIRTAKVNLLSTVNWNHLVRVDTMASTHPDSAPLRPPLSLLFLDGKVLKLLWLSPCRTEKRFKRLTNDLNGARTPGNRPKDEKFVFFFCPPDSSLFCISHSTVYPRLARPSSEPFFSFHSVRSIALWH